MESNIKNSDTKMVVAINQRKGFEGIRLENPFVLKVGQVFTGIGIGCGIGIGVGRPINLGTAHSFLFLVHFFMQIKNPNP